MFWCILYHFMMFYSWNHIKMNQDPSRSMMMCDVKIKILKWWWKYDPYVFIRGWLSYTICFRFTFRVNKHVLMYIVSFYDVLFMKSYQNESRSMMMWKSKYWNDDANMIHMCSLGVDYHIQHVFGSFSE